MLGHFITNDNVTVFNNLLLESEANNFFPNNCYFSSRELLTNAVNTFLKGLLKIQISGSPLCIPKGIREKYAPLLAVERKDYGNYLRCCVCQPSCATLKCHAKIFNDIIYYTLNGDSIKIMNERKERGKKCEYEEAGSRTESDTHVMKLDNGREFHSVNPNGKLASSSSG